MTEIEGEPWLPSSRKDADGPATIADSLAQLFVAGGSVDWKAAEPGRRITLPAYPFARKRYWMVRSPVERHLAGPVRGESESAAAPLATYATSWRRRPAPAIATMERGRWLVVAEESGIAAPLAEALEHAGARCLVATHGGVPAGAASNRRALDLDAADAFDVLFSGADPTAGVVYVAGREDADAARHASIGIHRIAGLSRAMARGGQAAGRLWIVTAGAVRVDAAGDADVVPSQTAWWGLGRAIALEQPSTWGGLVDTGLPAADPSQVSDAILAGGDEDQVAIRHGERWVARLVTHTPAATRPISLDARGVYLVTGGLGALGARTARWLVDRGARRLVLVGRSGTSHPSGAAAVASLQSAGADVQVVVADVANPADVARLFADIDRGTAPLKGVVHAAGVDRPEPLDRLTTEAANAVLAPKVAGTWLLHSHTQHRSLDLFLCFSSISAVLGAAGRAAYAAANAFQDGLVEHRRHLGLAGNSVEWGPWRGGGIATPASLQEFERIGNFGLDPDEAVAALDLLVADSTPVTAVAAIDWDRFRTAYEARRARPLISEISAGSFAAPHPEQTSGAPWCEELADVAVADREGWLTMRLRAEAAAILGFAEPGELSLDQSVYDSGMDSLMAADFARRVQQGTGVATGSLVFDYALLPALAHRLLQDIDAAGLNALEGGLPAGSAPAAPGAPGSTASRSALVELSPAERRGAIGDGVRAEVAATLGFESPGQVSADLTFSEMGMDSLMAAELASRLRARFGIERTGMAFEYPTVLLLTDRLLEDVAEMASAAPAADSRAVPPPVVVAAAAGGSAGGAASATLTAPDVTQGLRLFASDDEEAVFAFQREAWPKRPAALIPSRWRWMFLDSAARLGREPQVWLYLARRRGRRPQRRDPRHAEDGRRGTADSVAGRHDGARGIPDPGRRRTVDARGAGGPAVCHLARPDRSDAGHSGAPRVGLRGKDAERAAAAAPRACAEGQAARAGCGGCRLGPAGDPGGA